MLVNNPAHRWYCHQEHSTWPKDAMGVQEGRADLVDDVKCLGQYEAIKLVRWNPVGCGKVGDDRRMWVCSVDIEHITALDADTIAVGVAAVLDFKHTAGNILSMLLQKTLDVVAIDRRAAVIAITVTQGRDATNGSKPRRTSETVDAFPLVRANSFHYVCQEGQSHTSAPVPPERTLACMVDSVTAVTHIFASPATPYRGDCQSNPGTSYRLPHAETVHQSAHAASQAEQSLIGFHPSPTSDGGGEAPAMPA